MGTQDGRRPEERKQKSFRDGAEETEVTSREVDGLRSGHAKASVLDSTLLIQLLIRVSHRWSARPDNVPPLICFFPSILWTLEGRALRFGGGWKENVCVKRRCQVQTVELTLPEFSPSAPGSCCTGTHSGP